MTSASDSLISRLAIARRNCAIPPGLAHRAHAFARDLLAFLFPHWATEYHPSPAAIVSERERLRVALAALLEGVRGMPRPSGGVVANEPADRFFAELSSVYDALLVDARAIFDGDPAARGVEEVIAAYPGFRAVAHYRVAHALHELGAPLVPRLITELGHRETGIDIHPAARIGEALAIDHGTGIVIGETTVIGDRVKLYQGVTLGAASVRKELARTKRHPTVEDDVVIYANATILGGETVVGARSIVGGNVWLTHSVPPDSVVSHEGVSARARRDRAPEDGEVLLEFYL
jgi:serine O-acetyltransferase